MTQAAPDWIIVPIIFAILLGIFACICLERIAEALSVIAGLP